MAGNRFDMIERAAARLRRDTPAQKPVIDQTAPPAPAQAAPQEDAQSPAPQQPFAAPKPDSSIDRSSRPPQPGNQPGAAVTPPNPPRQLIHNLQQMPLKRQSQATPPDDAPMPVAPPVPQEVKAPAVKTSRSVVLDTARLALAGTIDWTADRTPVMEELRLIKRRLLRRAFNEANGPDSISHLVMITSAKPREGKTFCSTNIAISISLEEDYNVLLVDADVRRQALRQNLGLEANQGFVDLLLNPGLDMADVLLRTNIPRLSILPAGMMSDRAPELLASSRMRDLIDDMAQRYRDRIIIFDTAPCLVSSDAATLAAHVGQVVFVVEAEQTQQHEIVAALNLISACPDIALVLNKAQPLATTSYGGYGAY
ncbi:MAG TPA: XrtA-associated tyrosine autokinase [Alphaproteobacteria bacterium]|jgi:exopolysaccharide/PEP-CTERM locus tyrosine autokinase|nr:XrtA-associated tyrosine autokinase [Alphaproteobacteria bacterium]